MTHTISTYLVAVALGVATTLAVPKVFPEAYARVTGDVVMTVEDVVNMVHLTEYLMDQAGSCKKDRGAGI